MAYTPRNPNGQGTMANSEPVVIASNQTAIPITDNSGSITVDGTVAVTSGVGATDLGKAEDAVHGDGDTGVMALAVRRDTSGAIAGTSGDYIPLTTDASGNLRVMVAGGFVAHDAVDSGNPQKIGGRASAAALADVSADNDRVDAWFLRNGAQATVVTAAGALIGGDAANGLDVDVTRVGGTVSVQSNSANLATQTTAAAIQTSVELIDDTVFTDDTSTHSTGATKGLGMMAVANPTDAAVDANDIGMVAMTTARAMKHDLTTIAGTAPTTVGKIDVKGADGDVFVRQATAANLNMTEASAASSLTSLQLIDDIVYTDDTSTHATGTSKGALIMGAATPTDTAVNANDIGAVGMTNNRELYVSLRDISGAAAVTGSGTATGALRVELPTNGTGVLSTVTSLTQMNGAAIAMNTGTRSAGTQRVTIATDDIVPAAQSGTWTVQPGNTPNTSPWLTTQTPKASGGLTTYHLVSAATTNATNIKASAGQVFGWYIYNSNAAARKLVFHNTAGSPTAGASVFFSIMIPPTSAANVEFTNGIAFSTGIAITTVTGLADTDSAAVALNDLIINVFYT